MGQDPLNLEEVSALRAELQAWPQGVVQRPMSPRVREGGERTVDARVRVGGGARAEGAEGGGSLPGPMHALLAALCRAWQPVPTLVQGGRPMHGGRR